jgi:Coenzyme PQQ synthesis protein D (PqqD)
MIRPDAIRRSFVPTRAPEVAWVELDGEVVVYHEPSAATMVLNATCSLLWQLFDGRSTLTEISRELADEFDAPVRAIQHDVMAATRELGARDLLAGVGPEREANGP